MPLAIARRTVSRSLLTALCLATLAPWASAWAAGSTIPTSGEGTGEKPQSKLWYNDGTWWAIIDRLGRGLHFYEFDGAQWNPAAFVDAELGSGGVADVKWNGRELFVLAYTSRPKLYEYTYDHALRVFTLSPGFPVSIPIVTGSETMVLDQDSTGRLWATYEGNDGDINVTYTTSPDHKAWAPPGLILRSGVNPDDISSVVAFAGNVGVFWSDQNRWDFGFRVHRDADPPEVWQPVETVASGTGISDDHICIKADGSGNLYAVAKDFSDHMRLFRRDVATGRWTTRTGVISGSGTRGIVMLCDDERLLYVPYTNWSSSALDINLRKASYSGLRFTTLASGFIHGAALNNCTGTKQVLPRGCFMVMCEGGGRTWWNGWGTLPPEGPQPPPPPIGVAAALVPMRTNDGDQPELELDLEFEEGAGQTAANAAGGQAAHLLVTNGKSGGSPSWVAGHRGSGLRFDGQGGYAEVASTERLRLPGSFTTEAWVRWEGAGPGTLLSKGKSQERNYQIQVRADGRIDFKWETAGGSAHGVTSKRALAPGAWQHIACEYDAQAGGSSIYLDGRLDAAHADAGTPVVTDAALEIGMRLSSRGTADYLVGALDGVRLWRGAVYHADFDPESPPLPRRLPSRSSAVQLSWLSPDLSHRLLFNVYRTVNSGARQRLTAAPTAALAIVDPHPTNGHLCYRVAAVDSLQREGQPSAAVCVDYGVEAPPAIRVDPAAPALLTAALGLRAGPNPFNPQTRLAFVMPEPGWARLAVYDVAGRRLALLHEGPLAAGEHRFEWSTTGPRANAGSGVYFARLETLGQSLHQKLVVVK